MDDIERLTRQLSSGRITRRQFFARALALGLSVSGVSALLAACGAQPPAPAAGTPQVAGALPSGVDPQRAVAELAYPQLPNWVRMRDISQVQTRGNTGEAPTWYTDVKITADQVREVAGRNFKAAFLNWDDAAYNQAVFTGALDACNAMGIKMAAVTNYRFNSATLKQNVSNVLALGPNIIFYSGVDPVADAEAMRPAIDQNIHVVAYANAPKDWKKGSPPQFVTLISYDTHEMGGVVADEVAKAFPNGAKLGMIYFDANYKLVNEREKGFEDRIRSKGNIEIVTRAPMADPYKTQEIASAMIARYPDLNVIFAPWDLPAEGVVAALRGAGRNDIKVATIDLGFTGAREIANDGLIFVESSQLVYDWGKVGAIAAALQLLGQQAPPYVIVPVFAVTKSNLLEGWRLGFGGKVNLPPEVTSKLKS